MTATQPMAPGEGARDLKDRNDQKDENDQKDYWRFRVPSGRGTTMGRDEFGRVAPRLLREHGVCGDGVDTHFAEEEGGVETVVGIDADEVE